MKVNELTGIGLDYYTAKAAGLKPRIIGNDEPSIDEPFIVVEYPYPSLEPLLEFDGEKYRRFDTDWNFIGQIIERDEIEYFIPMKGKCYFDYESIDLAMNYSCEATGLTTLEAIKRCIVKRKYGEEVKE